MQSETKQCQNCKASFEIDAADFDFYEKIKVPPPTWCPECRMIRKVAWRNERSLYKRKCDAPGHSEEVVAIFSPQFKGRVYDYKYWWSDEWDAAAYAKNYDFTKSFFQQFRELLLTVPHPNVIINNSVNANYCHSLLDCKNCYLVFGASHAEDSYYAAWLDYVKDSFDILWCQHGEKYYDSLYCTESYNLLFSTFSTQCSDSVLLWDCRNCNNCFGCVGLRNKKYHIFNRPYSKDDYFKKVKEYDLGNYKELIGILKIFEEFRLTYPYKFARIYNSVDSTGDNLLHAKNSYLCFDSTVEGFEDNHYVVVSFGESIKDSHSSIGVGRTSSLVYEGISVVNVNNVYFSKKIWTGHDIQYSYNCHNCSNLFGCVGLRNKNYCIFNKQYTKEGYNALVSSIQKHMSGMPYTDSKGRIYKYGEFFPFEISPFAYNETIAQEYFSLSAESARAAGYKWRDADRKDYKVTMSASELSDHIKNVDDTILNQTIGCAHEGKCHEQCTTAFRIIPQELAFYRQNNLPLPRLCPNCRHYQRLARRNPFKLWKRGCTCSGKFSMNKIYQNQSPHFHKDQPCPHTFKTSYSPERPEIVYCEQCYQQEVV